MVNITAHCGVGRHGVVLCMYGCNSIFLYFGLFSKDEYLAKLCVWSAILYWFSTARDTTKMFRCLDECLWVLKYFCACSHNHYLDKNWRNFLLLTNTKPASVIASFIGGTKVIVLDFGRETVFLCFFFPKNIKFMYVFHLVSQGTAFLNIL